MGWRRERERERKYFKHWKPLEKWKENYSTDAAKVQHKYLYWEGKNRRNGGENNNVDLNKKNKDKEEKSFHNKA